MAPGTRHLAPGTWHQARYDQASPGPGRPGGRVDVLVPGEGVSWPGLLPVSVSVSVVVFVGIV